jgi:hypothetical protein
MEIPNGSMHHGVSKQFTYGPTKPTCDHASLSLSWVPNEIHGDIQPSVVQNNWSQIERKWSFLKFLTGCDAELLQIRVWRKIYMVAISKHVHIYHIKYLKDRWTDGDNFFSTFFYGKNSLGICFLLNLLWDYVG